MYYRISMSGGDFYLFYFLGWVFFFYSETKLKNGVDTVALTELIFSLDRCVSLHIGSKPDPVSGADSEQVQGVPLEAGHSVLWTFSLVRDQSPGLPFHIAPLNDVAGDFAAAVILGLLPRQADLSIRGIHHLQVLHRSRDVCGHHKNNGCDICYKKMNE